MWPVASGSTDLPFLTNPCPRACHTIRKGEPDNQEKVCSPSTTLWLQPFVHVDRPPNLQPSPFALQHEAPTSQNISYREVGMEEWGKEETVIGSKSTRSLCLLDYIPFETVYFIGKSNMRDSLTVSLYFIGWYLWFQGLAHHISSLSHLVLYTPTNANYLKFPEPRNLESLSSHSFLPSLTIISSALPPNLQKE